MAQGRDGAGWRKVYHVLAEEDLALDLRCRQAFVLRPADGLWYEARLERLAGRQCAVRIAYVGTREEEKMDLQELVGARQVAVVDVRPPGLAVGDGDVPDDCLALATTRGPAGAAGKCAERTRDLS